MKRASLSKKTRFEIFKRDSFTCQYCGQSAPDVILHVDHINPVKDGGKNDLVNLITSCIDCNLGKGATQISDNSVVKKQKKQLDDLNERRNQIQMMAEWRASLADLETSQVEAVNDVLSQATGYSFNEYGRSDIRKTIKKCGFDNVLEAAYISIEQYLKIGKDGKYTAESISKAFDMVSRVAFGIIKKAENPQMGEFYYIRAILRNRFSSWYPSLERESIYWLQSAFDNGLEIEHLKYIAKVSTSWTNFRERINAALREV